MLNYTPREKSFGVFFFVPKPFLIFVIQTNEKSMCKPNGFKIDVKKKLKSKQIEKL